MAENRRVESRLREKLGRFLHKSGKVRQATAALRVWEDRGWEPILFGGVLRDLVVLGNRHYPRDVDVVLQHIQTEDLKGELQGADYRMNRFGGFHLCINHWAFDVWPLNTTWAFKTDTTLFPSAANLPKTTFLNVEAIAVTFSGGRVDKIYSNGFFEAIEKKRIDINYRRNPYPALNAVRAIMIASKLRFRMSSAVGRYFLETFQEFGPASMIEAQDRHYGRVYFQSAALTALHKHFYEATVQDEQADIGLPSFLQPEQMLLWPH